MKYQVVKDPNVMIEFSLSKTLVDESSNYAFFASFIIAGKGFIIDFWKLSNK